MKTRTQAIPGKAAFLYLLLGIGGLFIAGALGAWLMPAAIAVIGRGDASLLSRMPRSLLILPEVAPWYTRNEHILWNVGGFIGLGAAALGMYLTDKWWRYLVIRKYKWATEAEVKAFYKRMI